MKRRLFSFSLAVFATCLLVSAKARAEVSDAVDAEQPFIVKIHADWCGTCRKLNPTWSELQKQQGDQARLVIFDVTNRETLGQAKAEAERLGLSEFLDANKSKTGVIAVLNGATREPVKLFKGELDASKYQAALSEARSVDPS